MKIIQVPDVGEVQLVKHAKSRSIRMTITHTGGVRITLPKWTPYQAGAAFAQAKKDWILAHRQTEDKLQHGFAVGKFHHLYFQVNNELTNVSTRQKGSELWVSYPPELSIDEPSVQAAARRISIKALRKQAENLLPKRLSDLATRHGFTYKSIEVRQLKARWGSCNNKQEITLNLFLMQLPWELIDYVLIHELTHTQALHHGEDFWRIFETALPGAKKMRKQLHTYKPSFAS